MPFGVFFLLLLGLTGFGVWAIGNGIKSSREAARSKSKLSSASLTALAEPYRGIMYEALECLKEIRGQVDNAPPALQRSMADMAARVEAVLERALPKARHASQLVAYLQRLERSSASADEADAAKLRDQVTDIENELRHLLAQLFTLRHKSYQVLGNAAKMDLGDANARDLQDVLFELSALEEVYAQSPNLTADLAADLTSELADGIALGRPKGVKK